MGERKRSRALEQVQDDHDLADCVEVAKTERLVAPAVLLRAVAIASRARAEEERLTAELDERVKDRTALLAESARLTALVVEMEKLRERWFIASDGRERLDDGDMADVLAEDGLVPDFIADVRAVLSKARKEGV